MDPVIGRFISVDPFYSIISTKNEKALLGLKANPQRVNTYAYSISNPLVNYDSNGLWDERVHFGSTEYGGTYKWAMDIGFSSEEAAIISDSSLAVDSLFGDKDPIPIGKYNQSYHFDTNKDPNIDSRMELAIYHLKRASILKKQGDIKKALVELGTGLHALQDIYAHIDEFATYEPNKNLYHHFGPNGDGFISFLKGESPKVDNPDFRPERLKEAEEATKTYFNIFINDQI